MEAFVIDVSACVPWFCEDERTNASEEIFRWAVGGSALHAPSLWTWEMLNTIGMVIRRRRISAERGHQFMEQLALFNLKIAPGPTIADFDRLHQLATLRGLTTYDTAYLDLARRLSLPLATLDTDLRRASLAEGIEVL